MRTLLITCMVVALTGPRMSFGQGANDVKPEDPVDPVKALQQRVDQLSALVQTLQNDKAKLQDRLDELSRIVGAGLADETLSTRVTQLSDTLNKVAKKDGEVVIPNIIAAMEKSAQFQNDFYEVTSATVEIQNNCGRSMELYLNGVRWNCPPGLTTVDVPYGPVRVDFVYFQRDKHWTYKESDWKREGHRARLELQIACGSARPAG